MGSRTGARRATHSVEMHAEGELSRSLPADDLFDLEGVRNYVARARKLAQQRASAADVDAQELPIAAADADRQR